MKTSISDEDIEAVLKALKGKLITQGELVPKFENKVAKKVNAKYGIVVNSATSALHLACLALDVGVGISSDITNFNCCIS